MGTMGQSITLANSIIGVGILAMPFCFQQCGVLLATLILLTMGLISRLCCYFLLKSALLARRRNFEFLAFHVFGPAGKLAVEVGIIGFLMGTCIAYFVVVGDLGPQIISKMFNINQSDILRTSIMVIVSLVCVLPLGLLRNVDSLSNVSAATIGFYFCLVIKIIVEAMAQLPSGEWRQHMELWSMKPAGVLQCVPIFSMALFCQTQLFEIFESLPSLSLEKMNAVTKTAINICTCVYFTLGLFGYIAFCTQDISGNILMSLSPTMASDVIKLGFVMSLAFSFPLIIFPCRASLYSFLYKKVHSSHHDHIINHSIPETTFRCITVGIIAVALFISLLIPNIELVLGLVGSTIGVLICVVFPAACFINVTFKNTNERVLAKGVLILGLGIMILGTYANLQAAENQIDKYDERFITQEKIDKIVEDFFEKRARIEDNNLKPIPIKDPVAIDANKLADIKKDSEVQPPNPVPPESNSVELKSPDTNIEKLKIDKSNDDKLVNDVLLPEKLKEEAADTVSDTHPKNLKLKLNGVKIANRENKVKNQGKLSVSAENKIEKIKLIKQQQLIETMKQHGEEQKELMQEQNKIIVDMIKNNKEMNAEIPKEIKPSNEPIVNADKHQQLIETIKQHGQEQKELMKEQKEILDEIKEMKQNTGSNEAKKIAVESIKQIADMAIKSIGDVTQKPDRQEENKKSEGLEKLTNKVVQEIAQKAVETIEAIKEIKENPDAAKIVQPSNDKAENVKDLSAIPVKVETNQKVEAPVENSNPQLNENVDSGKQTNVNKRVLHSAPLEPHSNIEANGEKVETKVADPIAEKVENKVNAVISNVDQDDIKNVAPIANDVAEKQNSEVETKVIPPAVVQKQNLNQNIMKPHSHSPDEPQSYKLGEDSQVQNVDNKHQNVPLAVAMSDQAKLETNALNANPIANPEVKENILNKDVKEIIPNLDTLVRQKRDVIETQEPLKPNQLRERYLPILDNSIDILPRVDLNDRLSRFPLDPEMLHIGRSLKNYDETKKDSDT